MRPLHTVVIAGVVLLAAVGRVSAASRGCAAFSHPPAWLSTRRPPKQKTGAGKSVFGRGGARNAG